jgi:hypothetical protein
VKQQIQYTTRIEDGRLPEIVRKNIARILKAWNGKVIILSIEEAKKKRTDRQNAFYWGVVLPCVMEMFRDAGSDATKEEIHIILKTTVGGLKREVKLPGGEVQEIATSSVKLSTEGWEIWMEQIREWAARWGTFVPLPNEYL